MIKKEIPKDTMIWITTTKEFLHQYNNAPKEVQFLQYPHRHILHFRVWLQVFHDDREVEFIMFKRDVDKMLNRIIIAGGKSCEMISDDLYKAITKVKKYQKRNITIEVGEDGENGSITYYPNQ